MRINSLKISGFRRFTNEVEIDLSADVVILYGPNGTGKTSILDAILWSITGAIPRFKTAGLPISKYARDGMARVEIHIQADENLIEITRALDTENNEKLRLKVGEETFTGSSAKAEISFLLLGSRNVAERLSKLTEIITRSVYLQQDLIREFIDADRPEDRFELLSEMAGVGAILDFQNKLEGNRKAWRKNINRIKSEELTPILDRCDVLSNQVDRLASSNYVSVDKERLETQAFFDACVESFPDFESLTAARNIDGFLRLLVIKRKEKSRFLDLLYTIKSNAKEIEQDPSTLRNEIESIANIISKKSLKASQLGTEIEHSLSEITRLQKLQLSKKVEAEQLSILAKIAMDHLDGPCPVCNQKHDARQTLEHLKKQQLVEDVYSEDLKILETDVHSLRESRDEIVAFINEKNSELKNLDFKCDMIEHKIQTLNDGLISIGLEPDFRSVAMIEDIVVQETRDLDSLENLLSRGEKLNLQSLRSSEFKQFEELNAELKQFQSKKDAILLQLKRLEKTDNVTSKIIGGLRELALDVTRNKIEKISPVFQRIYSRIDPHPTFKVTQLVTDKYRGKGRMSIGLTDPNFDEDVFEASPVLSSSQLNSFAVSLFLSLNLSLPNFQLDLTILDDPLQNLDTINLLGLVDVLRRFKKHKQIFISTHDPRLQGLLERKLRPVNENERLMTLAFENWSVDGPSFVQVPKNFDGPQINVLTEVG